ncbi:hypothetical protein I317_02448 [Kwoniella heveanensis CBS 569]|nr:hypothetical protein I317_02448 [Kwoniella heveanensis CBS 569]
MRRKAPLIALLAALSAPTLVTATHLTDSLLNKVYNVMNEISSASWENGTRAQAILESKYPDLSVFAQKAPLPLSSDMSSGSIPEIIDIAQTTMENRPASSNNTASFNGSTLLEDGAAGDPASLGITVLIANATTNNQQVNGVGYGAAATAELNYLLNSVPKAPNGAISHRTDQAQLWSDSVYMVPPFLAYYGVMHNNQSLLQEAYQQCSLYRDTLRQDSGLWAHILLGTGTHDPGLWATGNGWAMMGMLRVYATIKWSQYADDMSSQTNDLADWVQEIFKASQQYITSDGLFHNYLDDTSSFKDTSSVALYAATGFRLSQLNITDAYTPNATALLGAASSYVNSTGYLTQVVNPYDFSKQGGESAEGQSFMVMAYAAYKEWDSLGRKGVNTKDDPLGESSSAPARFGTGVGAGALALVLGVLGWTLV